MKTLLECDTIIQQSKDCVSKTVKRLEDKLRVTENKRLLNRILYMMQMTQDKQVCVCFRWSRHTFAALHGLVLEFEPAQVDVTICTQSTVDCACDSWCLPCLQVHMQGPSRLICTNREPVSCKYGLTLCVPVPVPARIHAV